MFVDKYFINAGAYNSKSKRCLNTKPSAYHFYIKAKISLDFHICISAPLIRFKQFLNLKLITFTFIQISIIALWSECFIVQIL